MSSECNIVSTFLIFWQIIVWGNRNWSPLIPCTLDWYNDSCDMTILPNFQACRQSSPASIAISPGRSISLSWNLQVKRCLWIFIGLCNIPVLFASRSGHWRPKFGEAYGRRWNRTGIRNPVCPVTHIAESPLYNYQGPADWVVACSKLEHFPSRNKRWFPAL